MSIGVVVDSKATDKEKVVEVLEGSLIRVMGKLQGIEELHGQVRVCGNYLGAENYCIGSL